MTTEDLMKLAESALNAQTGYCLQTNLYTLEVAKKARQALLDALEALGREVAEKQRVLDGCNATLAAAKLALDLANDQRDQARAELAAIRATQEPEQAVYLVCTGETHNGEETYTRHDVLPPFCDAEKLYASPAAKDAGLVADGWKLAPVEPDETMTACGDMNLSCGAADVYRAMLAASPKIGGV